IAISRDAGPVRVLVYKKRAGEIVTRDDPDGRRTVFRKLPKLETGRWIAIGRLDINTSGLLLFTNSGELARRLMHPSYEIEREYAVRVLGEVDDEMLERLADNVSLDDGPAHFDKVWRAGRPPDEEEAVSANQWFHVVVREGRHRLVRKLWESQRCQVSRLIRVRFGPVELGRGIKSSGYRELEPREIRELGRAVG
ncbi:MAG: pseudouridine synthase, partial [Hydrocarboniphaga effusa]|nr:pseudouridine synthase [Hydrocarboniphaga effusa]